MNKITAALIMMSVALLTSCSTTFYQVYTTETSESISKNKNSLIFEDDNCIITYNLWKHGGDVGFTFYNKTEEMIFLNLEESFFIRNGIANDYYKDRIFESSIHSAIAVSSNTVSHFEKNIVSIPAKTAKIISEYVVSNAVYRDCSLRLHPTKSQIKTENFNKSNSPLNFSNQLSYRIQDSDTVKIENSFYVSAITNYPEKEILTQVKEEFCGQKPMLKSKTFNSSSPNQFYIKYDKIKDWKH